MKGIVKMVNQEKGFGFITPEDGSPDVFFHHSVVTGDGIKELNKDDVVTFESVPAERGPKATTVTKGEAMGEAA